MRSDVQVGPVSWWRCLTLLWLSVFYFNNFISPRSSDFTTIKHCNATCLQWMKNVFAYTYVFILTIHFFIHKNFKRTISKKKKKYILTDICAFLNRLHKFDYLIFRKSKEKKIIYGNITNTFVTRATGRRQGHEYRVIAILSDFSRLVQH